MHHTKVAKHHIITKHLCDHCKEKYYTIDDTPECCPFHYVKGGTFYDHNYTIDEERKLSQLRHEYIGKCIPIDDGLIIILEVLDLDNIEFILMPTHRIYVASFSYINDLKN